MVHESVAKRTRLQRAKRSETRFKKLKNSRKVAHSERKRRKGRKIGDNLGESSHHGDDDDEVMLIDEDEYKRRVGIVFEDRFKSEHLGIEGKNGLCKTNSGYYEGVKEKISYGDIGLGVQGKGKEITDVDDDSHDADDGSDSDDSASSLKIVGESYNHPSAFQDFNDDVGDDSDDSSSSLKIIGESYNHPLAFEDFDDDDDDDDDGDDSDDSGSSLKIIGETFNHPSAFEDFDDYYGDNGGVVNLGLGEENRNSIGKTDENEFKSSMENDEREAESSNFGLSSPSSSEEDDATSDIDYGVYGLETGSSSEETLSSGYANDEGNHDEDSQRLEKSELSWEKKKSISEENKREEIYNESELKRRKFEGLDLPASSAYNHGVVRRRTRSFFKASTACKLSYEGSPSCPLIVDVEEVSSTDREDTELVEKIKRTRSDASGNSWRISRL